MWESSDVARRGKRWHTNTGEREAVATSCLLSGEAATWLMSSSDKTLSPFLIVAPKRCISPLGRLLERAALRLPPWQTLLSGEHLLCGAVNVFLIQPRYGYCTGCQSIVACWWRTAR